MSANASEVAEPAKTRMLKYCCFRNHTTEFYSSLGSWSVGSKAARAAVASNFFVRRWRLQRSGATRVSGYALEPSAGRIPPSLVSSSACGRIPGGWRSASPGQAEPTEPLQTASLPLTAGRICLRR